MVETKYLLATTDGDIGRAFVGLGEKGTKGPGFGPGFFAWSVSLVVCCSGNFGGWGCTSLFPDILYGRLQEFTG